MIRIVSILLLASVTVSTVGAQIAGHVVISEVYGGGGNSGSTWKNDFVELYNPTSSPVNLNGWSVQYNSATGTGTWQVTNLAGSIPAYGFYLVQEAQGTGGIQNLPTPDVVGVIAMSSSAGKIALLSTTNALTGAVVSGASIVDKVGYGTTASDFEGGGPALAPSNTLSIERKAQSSSTAASLASGSDANLGNGYDSDNNANDFVTQSIINPQNSSSPVEVPPGGGGGSGDTNPPIVISVKATSNTQVEVLFNEPVDSSTSSASANYSLNKSASVSQALRSVSNISKVVLTVSPLGNDVYSLTVQSVKDTSGNAMSVPQSVSFVNGVLTMAQARSARAGLPVRVRGIITVSNQFGSPSYLQDSTGALAVFNSTFSTSAKIGDVWEVAGTLQDFNGLLEVNPVSDSIRISSGNALPQPRVLSTKQVGELYEAQLIRINKLKFDSVGTFSGNTNYVARDADSSVTVRIVTATGISSSSIPLDSVNVVGVLGEFNGVYQLLPRSFGDIGVVDPLPGQTWMDIITARGQLEGASVKVRGIVTYNQPPSTSYRTIYIQDATAGIALFDPKSDTLLVGDSVEVKGVLYQFNNLLEIKPIDSLTLLGRGLLIPQPISLTIGTASERYESELVILPEVQFVELGSFTGSTTYHVSDGSSQLDVRIPANSALAGTVIPVGALNITGILGQFTTRYQLIPRTPSDFVSLPGPQIVGPPVLSSLTDTGFSIQWTTLLSSDTRLYYGPTQALSDSIVVQESALAHAVIVSGLKSGRVYYYKVSSTNLAGTSSSGIVPVVTTSSASSGQMYVYFNYPADTTLGLNPRANGSAPLMTKLLERISAASQSIDFALYSFEDFGSSTAIVADRIADSLIGAKTRGVKIRVVYQDRPTSAALQKLINVGISVLKRNYPETGSGMHNKFWIFDGRDTTSATDDWVVTGSWNVTNTGTFDDSQNAVFIQDQSLARIYTIEFEEMFGSSGETANPSNARFGPIKQDNTPHMTFVKGKKVEAYFSPSDRTSSAITRAINSANYNVFFALLTMTRDDIANALIARKAAGVIVRGIIDNNDQGTKYPTLFAAGIDVHWASHSVVKGEFHHKYGVVDPYHDSSDPLVITGSHNWTTSAETDNDENTLIIHSGELARQYVQEFSKRYQESGGTGMILGVEEIRQTVPKAFALSQNFPNPFNPTTAISYQLSAVSYVTLRVFDILGRVVATLVNEEKPAGVYNVQWNTSNATSGVYFYRLDAGSFTQTRKMVLIK